MPPRTVVVHCWPARHIEFEVQADLDKTSRRLLKEDLSNLLGHYWFVDDRVEKVVVSRPTSDPRDERIVAVVRSARGAHLGSIVGEANGLGALCFNPPEP